MQVHIVNSFPVMARILAELCSEFGIPEIMIGGTETLAEGLADACRVVIVDDTCVDPRQLRLAKAKVLILTRDITQFAGYAAIQKNQPWQQFKAELSETLSVQFARDTASA